MLRYVLASAFALPLVFHTAPSAGAKRPPDSERPTASAPPVAGEYACHVLAMGGSIATPYGAAPTLTVMPSVIVSLGLDEAGNYSHSSGSGRFHYDKTTGKVSFESGPFQGWSSRSETDGKLPWLRFGATMDAALAPTSRLGDHICVLQR